MILLAGGDKSSQAKDIARAKELAANLRGGGDEDKDNNLEGGEPSEDERGA